MNWEPGPRTLLPLLLGAALLVPVPPPASTDAPRCPRAFEKFAAQADGSAARADRTANEGLRLPPVDEGGSFGL